MNMSKSRYNQKRKVTNNGGGCYTIEGESRFYRVAACPETGKVNMFDFEGGPCLFVGDNFPAENTKSIIEELIVEKTDIDNYAKVTIVVRED